MDPEQLTSYLSKKGFSVKQVPLVNTLGKLGQDGVNTFDLTANFCDKYIGSKFFTCTNCSKMFNSQTALNNHIKSEHYSAISSNAIQEKRETTAKLEASEGETSYIIIRSDPDASIFGYKKTRSRRIETRPRKPYEKRSGGLHTKIEIDGPFSCNVCGEAFEECCNFSMHMNSVHFKRRRLILRCQICEKRFTGKHGFDENAESPVVRNASAPQLGCNICNRTFSLQAHLDYHQKKHHSKIKPYECSLCNKSFTQVTGLSQHMKTHSGIRPFVCSICSKAFRQKAGLDQHMRIHSKVKPYLCLICNRAFTQSAHLSQHMRLHTKIEPFECGVCNRRFKQSSHLNFHLRSHESNDGESRDDYGITITPLNKDYQLINELTSTISQ